MEFFGQHTQKSKLILLIAQSLVRSLPQLYTNVS